ncbi:CHAT domain-containing protein [Daldinia decipiens]|uniref:CHAT domain-containing protein n=1 Tax=Daldinia decipiens TaxID=326647 RepID=UPI0020C1BD1C|nr:CHAT domain-containing protein [Daldinia decipiens]KAI1658969.1 CHAT domain-containing protein [Daldinia decipiens]
MGPSSDLTSLLEWLWHTIYRPCLNALGFKGPIVDNKWPHIWWIATSTLSQLPFHAAGIYTNTSKETILNKVISSYASSIRELIHTRQLYSQKTVKDCQTDSALLVTMQNTPGLSTTGDLPYAGKEIDILSKLCPSLQLNAITPRRSKSEVLKHLHRRKLFHFAGHGRSDLEDPSNSFLYLEDWEHGPLTVENLRESRLHENPPFLAYLSACSTGTNKVESLSDEGIHLVSAFQLAGFRHVIGTL